MKALYALVGMKHRRTEALVAALPQSEPLTLVRDPTNKFDPWAVQVWARGQHIGFIKATQVRPLALAMDREVAHASIISCGPLDIPRRASLAIDGGKWPMVEVEE